MYSQLFNRPQPQPSSPGLGDSSAVTPPESQESALNPLDGVSIPEPEESKPIPTFNPSTTKRNVSDLLVRAGVRKKAEERAEEAGQVDFIKQDMIDATQREQELQAKYDAMMNDLLAAGTTKPAPTLAQPSMEESIAGIIAGLITGDPATASNEVAQMALNRQMADYNAKMQEAEHRKAIIQARLGEVQTRMAETRAELRGIRATQYQAIENEKERVFRRALTLEGQDFQREMAKFQHWSNAEGARVAFANQLNMAKMGWQVEANFRKADQEFQKAMAAQGRAWQKEDASVGFLLSAVSKATDPNAVSHVVDSLNKLGYDVGEEFESALMAIVENNKAIYDQEQKNIQTGFGLDLARINAANQGGGGNYYGDGSGGAPSSMPGHIPTGQAGNQALDPASVGFAPPSLEGQIGGQTRVVPQSGGQGAVQDNRPHALSAAGFEAIETRNKTRTQIRVLESNISNLKTRIKNHSGGSREKPSKEELQQQLAQAQIELKGAQATMSTEKARLIQEIRKSPSTKKWFDKLRSETMAAFKEIDRSVAEGDITREEGLKRKRALRDEFAATTSFNDIEVPDK